jgi:CBS domain-containing protein
VLRKIREALQPGLAFSGFRKARSMKVKDLMTKEAKTCTPETDLATAAESMWMRDCGILPVVDDKRRVAGMITDRDICIATGCHRRDPATILVKEVMTGQVFSCSPETDIGEALQIMQWKQVHRLPVIDSAGKLCGVLSLTDIALKIDPNATEPEPCARDIHAALRLICARRSKLPEAPWTKPQTHIQRREDATA